MRTARRFFFIPALDPEFPKNTLDIRQGDGGYPIGPRIVKPGGPFVEPVFFVERRRAALSASAREYGFPGINGPNPRLTPAFPEAGTTVSSVGFWYRSAVELKRSSLGSVEVVSFVGSLDAASVSGVRPQIRDLTSSGADRIVFDLSRVDFIDSSGLSIFVGALNAVRKSGGEIALAGLSPEVRSIVELTRLHRVFPIFDDALQAASSIARQAR